MTKLYVAAILMALLACTAMSAPVDDVNVAPIAEENYRLPTNIMPSTYHMTLKPYLLPSDGTRQFTFDGEVFIEFMSDVVTRSISMHSKNLAYTTREYWPTASASAKKNLANVEPNALTDILTYTLDADLAANTSYTMHFVYTGLMGDDMHGFYRSSYVDKDNNTKWIGSTQFQTNHARRAFPSFDEPKFKAKFDVSITRHKSMNSFGNTALEKSTSSTDGEWATDLYKLTPPMSTYLLAFIVSEFTVRENTDKSFGVIARPEYYDQTEYSYTVGPKILTALSNYFGIDYYNMGNDKMHMAAIPDFSAGAMENWGLLTYRERALLFVQDSTTLSAKQSIAGVIAHEQAHMWFGDYVTCDWWSYTWLNEGFARYFQYFGTAMVETDMGLDQQFVVDQVQTVMNMDSTVNTNPMSDENTNTPADLSRMFNSISYNKGGTFIRMVQSILGEDNFKKSLNEYLNKHKLSNTIPQNLFDVWKKYWPTEFATYVDSFFNTYTLQVGYPVVHVEVSDDAKSSVLTQERFLLKENDGADRTLQYTVPITLTNSQKKNFSTTKPLFFLQTENRTHQFDESSDWVIANVQEIGYYRVNYNEKNWHALHHALHSDNWGGIHELNRAQIADDLLNLARASVITYELALEVLEYLETETNYLPWTAAFNGYSYLAIRLGTETTNFGIYIRDLTEKAYKKLGFVEQSSDSALDIYNRAKVLSWSCKYGNTECIAEAKKYFNAMKNSNTAVPVNIRSAVYCTAMREGTKEDYDALYKKFETETVATEQTLILNTLGCVKEQAQIEDYFNKIVTVVRRQDKSAALSSLYTENNENVSPVFKLVTNNVDKLAEAMGGYSAVATVISNIASRFTEEQQEKDLKTFNEQNKSKFGSAASTLETAEKNVRENLEWSTKKLGTFKTYLAKRLDNGSTTISSLTVITMIMFSAIAMLWR